MDCIKIGKLIFAIRKEKGMTQKQLADKMGLSDKTISKWERGLGCPDISLLHELSEILEINVEKILLGSLELNDRQGGNMKKIKFYICPNCGNIITALGEADISCCGRRINPSIINPRDEEHKLSLETLEDDYYITFSHPMTKEHYLNFIACVSYDRVFLVKLYPEQGSEIRIPKINKAKLYFGCSSHGVWENN